VGFVILKDLRCLRDRILRDFPLGRKHPSLSIFERAWLAESRSGHPDWPELLAELREGVEAAGRWGMPNLAINAEKVISIVKDEELGESDTAIEGLRAAQARLGPSSTLREQEANIRFRRGEHQNALAIWREVYSDPGRISLPGHDHYSCRKAAISASSSELFQEAAKWLERGAEFAVARGELAGPTRESFLIDASHCWFRAGRGDKAVELLARAIGSLPGQVACTDPRRAFMNLKSAGHFIFWAIGRLTAPSSGEVLLGEPLVGQCSIAEVGDDLAGLPATSWERAAAGLVRLDGLLSSKSSAVAILKNHACRRSVPSASRFCTQV